MPAPGVPIRLPSGFQFGPAPFDPDVAKNGTNGTNGSNGSNGSNGHGTNGHGTNGHGTNGHGTNGAATLPDPPLDLLENFRGTFSGRGFNTIFRPDSSKTPTRMSVKPTDNLDDNVLELNVTAETQVFSDSLGSIPNRGIGDQADIFLNGLPYTQSVYDVTQKKLGEPLPKDGKGLTAIHFESGLWMRVPPSSGLAASYNRMASIPHGTTINAQGFQAAVTSKGPPTFNPVDITPIFLSNGQPFKFPNQTLTNTSTRRLPFPQDLGLITQAMVSDPNTVLRDANKGKDIVQNVTFSVSTEAQGSNFGGGTSNIGFLVGDEARGVVPNAKAFNVTATYWISTVRTKLDLKPFKPVGNQTIEVSATPLRPGDIVPTFVIDFEIPAAKTVTVEYTQIQYSQIVNLDFAPLRWPHATVATLAPIGAKLTKTQLGL